MWLNLKCSFLKNNTEKTVKISNVIIKLIYIKSIKKF